MIATSQSQDTALVDRLAVEWMAEVLDQTNAPRISRATELVKAGRVERTSVPGRYLVGSRSNPNGSYLVDHGTCHCADAAKRDSRNCLHAWAVRLFAAAERRDAERQDPTPLIVICPPEDVILDVWPVWPGEPCALPPQCPRCHAEPRSTRHRDGLGLVCIGRELFGDGPDTAA